jgi:hypothetical protein
MKLKNALIQGLVVAAVCGLSTASYAQYYSYGYPEPIYPRPYYRAVPVIPQPYYAPAPEPRYSYPVDPEQYTPPQRHYSSDLTRKCALASELIRRGNCGVEGCDIAYCISLRNGCHINSWGHVCPKY